MDKKVVICLANGVEEIEALTVVDILRRSRIDITVAAVGGNKTIASSHGIIINCDTTVESINWNDIYMLVLPGGMPGTLNLDKDPTVNNAIEVLNKKGNPIAAICAAPSILGKRGLLEGHKACCVPGFEEELKGAEVIMDKKVVTDGQFITAPGMGCSVDFGLAILEYMQGSEAKAEMAKRIEFGTRN